MGIIFNDVKIVDNFAANFVSKSLGVCGWRCEKRACDKVRIEPLTIFFILFLLNYYGVLLDIVCYVSHVDKVVDLTIVQNVNNINLDNLLSII